MPDIDVLADTLSTGLQNSRLAFPKTLIFCGLRDTSTLYKLIRSKLEKDFTEPSGYPDLHCFRLVDMFHRPCKKDIKKNLDSFVQHDGRLRIATAAFMGIDCRDIRNIIHFRPPSTIEQYTQEAGRPGWDGSSQLHYCCMEEQSVNMLKKGFKRMERTLVYVVVNWFLKTSFFTTKISVSHH